MPSCVCPQWAWAGCPTFVVSPSFISASHPRGHSSSSDVRLALRGPPGQWVRPPSAAEGHPFDGCKLVYDLCEGWPAPGIEAEAAVHELSLPPGRGFRVNMIQCSVQFSSRGGGTVGQPPAWAWDLQGSCTVQCTCSVICTCCCACPMRVTVDLHLPSWSLNIVSQPRGGNQLCEPLMINPNTRDS